jgi:serine/threonine-protein kinase
MEQEAAYGAGGVVGGEFCEEAAGLLSGFAVGSRLAGYRLEERIGAGGMAVVFRARDERLGRRVALKILAPALAADEAFQRRFIREARAAAAVDDPHIIPVFEAGEAGGVLFIAMRYVPGGDLRSLVRRVGPLSAGRAAAIVSSVASALDAAHGAGLVHCDVKPANMLVDARPGRPDHVYLSDFGLSKAALSSSGPTGLGQFLGTASYAAPEQIGGKPADGRADQYSLACAAFELLGGAPPFQREYAGAVIWAHMSERPPPLTSRRLEFPAAVDGVLARALAKAPEDRYASCREFAKALRAALGLAPYNSESQVSPQASHARTVILSAGAGTAQVGGISPVAALAEASRGRSAFQATTADAAYETTPSGPVTLAAHEPRYARASLSVRQGRVRFRLIAPISVLIAAVSVVLAFSGAAAPAAVRHPAPARLPPPRLVSYLGVYVAGRPAYRQVADFADAVGRPPDLAGYVRGWAEPFPASFARTIRQHGAIPLVQIDPAGVSVAAIAAGDDDSYLRAYASGVRKFGHAVVIGFGQNMNAPGHSWGYGYVPARTFIAAWRHIVALFRDQGAGNVTWLWSISADRRGTGPAASWWPGAAYVTWISIDGHYSRYCDTFASVFDRTIGQVRQFTSRPMLLSVTSAGPAACQFNRIGGLFAGMRRSGALGLMWSGQDQRHGNHHPSSVIDSSATAAFRLYAAGLTLRRP